MSRRALSALLGSFLALACGDPEPAEPGFEVDPQTLALIEKAFANLNKHAPEQVRIEVLRSCDKWRHIDRPCIDEEVRVDQLECWNDVGKRQMTLGAQTRLRPRARDLKTLRHQNLCMEKRRWRKLEPGPDF
jgi:hypothetical protein